MTIVIPVAGDIGPAGARLESLAVAIPPSPAVEVIVVVTGDEDGELPVPEEFPVDVRVERCAEATVGAARNEGIAAARGGLTWLVDARAVVTGAALRSHWTHDRAEAEVLVGPCAVPSG